MNSKIFGLADRQKSIEMDLVEFYEGKGSRDYAKEMAFYKSVCSDLGYPL